MTDLTPAQVAGHTKPRAGRVLQRLAASVAPTLAIVEIGVFKGRSACYLGTGARDGAGAHVWGVDPWDLPGERYPFNWMQERPSRHAFTKPETREAAEAAVRDLGLEDTVTLVRGFSADVGATWDGPRIGLLHVDGDHRANAIRADWFAWRPHLAPGSVVAFDDHVRTCADVITVVSELVRTHQIDPPRMATRRLAVTRVR